MVQKNKFLLIIKTVTGVIQLSIRIEVVKTHDYYLLVQILTQKRRSVHTTLSNFILIWAVKLPHGKHITYVQAKIYPWITLFNPPQPFIIVANKEYFDSVNEPGSSRCMPGVLLSTWTCKRFKERYWNTVEM